MLDFLKGAANLLAGPLSTAVDFAGNTLGLPPLITQSVKAATGAATGNVMMAASGAMGMAQELSKNPPAKTEYRPSSSGGQPRVGEGYASSPSVLAPGASPLDPKMADYADALRVLEANFDQLDLLDGKKGGSLSKKDLERLANDASVSLQLRDAARFLLENKALFERLDNPGTAGRGGFFGLVGVLRNLDTFSLKDLRGELDRVEQEFARYGRPGRPGPGPTPGPEPVCEVPVPVPPRPVPPRPVPPTPVPPTPAPGRPGEGLDPNFREYRDALSVLSRNWDTFDGAVGARDNLLTRDNLDAILANPATSPTLKRAAQFFKDHPEYYDRLEMAAGVGGRDGIVGRPDVAAALRDADRVLGGSGTPSSSGGGASVRGILDNPQMSIEDKVQAILGSINRDTDGEILDVMRDMASARDEQATLGTSEADRKKAAKLETSMQELNLRLQKLMEKRKAMFDLMSNMSSKFHEMAKTAITNLRSA
jgi:hypothetical protein